MYSIFQLTVNGVYFYPHTKASKFSTRKEWKRTACVRTLISSLERWYKNNRESLLEEIFGDEGLINADDIVCFAPPLKAANKSPNTFCPFSNYRNPHQIF
jgi:hypothetical protein